MKRNFIISILLFTLFTPIVANAFQEGTYYSQSQQGMAVVFQNGRWGMYMNGQIYDGGTYSVQGSNIYFASQSGRQYPPATIMDACSFSWGQSGTFYNQGCSSGMQSYNSQMSSSFGEGTYYSQSQQGMAIVFQNGRWGMYLNGQIYDGGTYSVQGSNIYFASQSGRQYPPATIMDACSFSWGQSGTFYKDGCSAGSSQVDPADYIPLLIVKQTGIYFYIPQLALPVGNSVYLLEVLAQLYDLNSATFVISAYDIIQSPEGYISALFAPQYAMIYCPYVVLLIEGQQPQIFQNIFFQVQADQSGYVYLTLYNIYGSNMPTYSQYSSGQYSGTSSGSTGYDPTLSNMYFNTMSNIMNSMHETSMAIIDNMNPSSSWDYDYDYNY